MSQTDRQIEHGEERRKGFRIPLCLATAAGCDAWMNVCYTKDIGQTGLFLMSQRLPADAVDFSIEFQLPNRLGLIRQTAMVVRTQPDNPRGFALVWKNLTQKNALILDDLMQRWKSAFMINKEDLRDKLKT